MNNIKITTANAFVKNMILRNAISLEILAEQKYLFDLERKIVELHIIAATNKETLIKKMNIVLNAQLFEYSAERAALTKLITEEINRIDEPTQEYKDTVTKKDIAEENMRKLYSKMLSISSMIPDEKEVVNYVFGDKKESNNCKNSTTIID